MRVGLNGPAACRGRSGSCAANTAGDASKEKLRPKPSRSRARRRPPRCPARSTDRAPSNRQAVPSSSDRFPACPSAGPEAPFCLRGSHRSAPACIRPAAPCAPADRRRPPRHKHSAAPTDRGLASADSHPPTRSSAARSPRAKDWARPCRAGPSERPENPRFFGWVYGNSDLNVDPRQAGFVFHFSPDGIGRGYVDTARPKLYTRSCSGGQDPVLRENWPDFLSAEFQAGVRILVQGPPGDMDPSQVWTPAGARTPTAGFTSFSPLVGGSLAAEGSGSGSNLFPFPTTIPADAVTPPGTNALGGGGSPDGNGGPGPSYNTLDLLGDPKDPAAETGRIDWGPQAPDDD